MSEASALRAPTELGDGLEIRRALDERGDPTIQIVATRSIASGEVIDVQTFDQVQFLYAWFGSAIAAMRKRLSERKS